MEGKSDIFLNKAYTSRCMNEIEKIFVITEERRSRWIMQVITDITFNISHRPVRKMKEFEQAVVKFIEYTIAIKKTRISNS